MALLETTTGTYDALAEKSRRFKAYEELFGMTVRSQFSLVALIGALVTPRKTLPCHDTSAVNLSRSDDLGSTSEADVPVPTAHYGKYLQGLRLTLSYTQVSNYADLDQAHKELSVHRTKWNLLADFEVCEGRWMGAACASIDPEEVQSKVCVRGACGVRIHSMTTYPLDSVTGQMYRSARIIR
jgi:hypothetical protein